jgi:hypothetical protein
LGNENETVSLENNACMNESVRTGAGGVWDLQGESLSSSDQSDSKSDNSAKIVS